MWKKIIETADDKVDSNGRAAEGENLHICIIHGYNKTTGKLHFTDSGDPDSPKGGFQQKKRNISPAVDAGL